MNLIYGIFQVLIANVIHLILSVFNSFALPKYLSIEAYADFKTFSLYRSYIGILHLGIIDGLYILCGGKRRSEIQEEYFYVKRSLLYLEIAITLLSVVIALVMGDFILLCTAFCIVPMNMVALYKMICQAVGEFKEYRIIFNMVSLLIFFFNLVCLFGLKVQNAYWYIGINIVSSMIAWLYYEWKEKKNYHKKRTYGLSQRKQSLVAYSKLGVVITMGNFVGIWITSMDKWFVKVLCDTKDFAYYSFATSMTQLLNVIMTAFSVTLYHFFCRSQTKNAVRRLRTAVLMAGAAMILSVYLLDWFIAHFLQKYAAAMEVLFIIFSAHYIMLVINAVYLNLYKALKLQKKYLYRMLQTMLLGIVLNGTLYYMWERTMRTFAIATFLTAVIWLIMCQIDLPEHRMSVREWFYLVGIISIFFVSRMIARNAAGCICGIGFLLYSFLLFFKEIGILGQSLKDFLISKGKIL